MTIRTSLTLTPMTTVALLALGGGCATMPAGPGFIDPRMAAAAQSETAKEVELILDGSGAITKIAVEDTNGDKTPPALRKLAEATFPGSTLGRYEQEIYPDRALVHEVEVKTADGKTCEVSANEAGVLRYSECNLKPEEIADAARKALDAALPGAEIVEAELRRTPGNPDEYRIEVTSGARKWYFRISPEGTVLERAIRVEAEITIPVK